MRVLQVLAARAAIQVATQIAAKKITAIQDCESETLLKTIATETVAAAIPLTTAITVQHK